MQRISGLREREPRDAHEGADLRDALVLRQRIELLLHVVEAEHVEVAPDEARVAAVQDQPHVLGGWPR